MTISPMVLAVPGNGLHGFRIDTTSMEPGHMYGTPWRALIWARSSAGRSFHYPDQAHTLWGPKTSVRP